MYKTGKYTLIYSCNRWEGEYIRGRILKLGFKVETMPWLLLCLNIFTPPTPTKVPFLVPYGTLSLCYQHRFLI